MSENTLLYALNRGLISRFALARLDIERLALSSEIHNNFIPRTLGSIMLRPGLKYIGGIDGNNAARCLSFVFSATDTAIVELTASKLRVWDGDTVITRASVSSAVTNGAFTSNLTSWTDNDESGSTSAWKTGGYMSLIGNTTTRAIRTQEVTVGVGDQGTEHALDIVIEYGPVICKVGSTDGDDDYVREVKLETGYHSLAFTPTGNFWIEFSSFELYETLVDSVAVASSGDMELTAPWGANDLGLIRYDQSGDIIYAACEGYRQRKIIRWDANSWSLVEYTPPKGPVRVINTGPITLAADGTTGDVTVTASESLFESGHAGAIFKHVALSQQRTATVTAQNSFTSAIEVSGVGENRIFGVVITGTWSATVTLQYSIGTEGNWIDFDTYTSNQSITVDDSLPNQLIYYRIGVKTGDFTSGSVGLTLTFAGGTQIGYLHIRSVSSATSAEAAVLSELGSTDATKNWHEAVWSDFRGWPSAVALDDGRLWWFGKYVAGSESDNYDGFDSDLEGDSKAIIRTIGFGPVDVINWAKSARELVYGTATMELVARSTTDMEPKTVTNFNQKRASSQGTGKVDAVLVDNSVFFVQKNDSSVYDLSLTADGYLATEINAHAPEVGEPSIVRVGVQRKPDTRVHFVRGDGKVALLIIDSVENLASWVTVETDGDIEDVVVLPGSEEDAVYYVVKRTINSSTVRYLEKWAIENDCRGGTYVYSGASTTTINDLDEYPDGITVTVYDSDDAKVEDLTVSNGSITLSTASTYARIVPTVHLHADSYIVYDSTAATTITGLSHLEGETVVIRGNGKDLGTKVVSSGQITGLSESVEKAVVGLSYTAKWKSTKLSMAPKRGGTAIGQRQTISQIGLILADTKQKGLQYGPDFNNLQTMRSVVGAETIDDDYIWRSYDVDMSSFLKKYRNDLRVCLQAAAPNPCTTMGVVLNIETHPKG